MATTLHPTSSQKVLINPEEKDFNPSSSDPFSAFYSHPTTRTSLDQAKCESKVNIKIYEHDLEAGSRITTHSNLQEHAAPGAAGMKKQCTMWPGKRQQFKKANISGTIRGSRACAPYRRLTKEQRIALQVILAILIVGAATGLGIGISKACGAGVWKSDNHEAPIGS